MQGYALEPRDHLASTVYHAEKYHIQMDILSYL